MVVPVFDTAHVKSWLQITGPDDDATLDIIVAAVKAQISRLPDVPLDLNGDWTDEVQLAGLMLAGRLFRRRNSPNGVEAFTDGGVVYVARYDPDIARMLRTDGFAPPRVG